MPNQDHEDLKSNPANKRTDADRKRSRGSSITFTYDLGAGEVTRTFMADTIKIGKISASALRLDHPSVSRMHAYVQRHGNEYFISDLGSAGGTHFADGPRINKARLSTGDVLRIGEVELKVQIGDVARDKPSAPSSYILKLGSAVREAVVETPEPKKPDSFLRRLGRAAGTAIRERRETREGTDKVYYCETCLTLHGNVVVMQQEACPTCGGGWKLNRGQARHTVSLKLQHYQQLAKKLGIE